MKKLLLIFLLLPILGFTQGFQTKTDTIHFLNQNKVIALGDTLNKKLDDSDTTSTVANQWRVNLKQNTIPNIADTSKYIEYSDTGTTANKIIKLDGAAKLPPVDGSQLTGISAGATILMAVKTADETVNNSSIYQNDDHLFVSVQANTTYIFSIFIHGRQLNATPNIKMQFTVPTGTTQRSNTFGSTSSGSAFRTYNAWSGTTVLFSDGAFWTSVTDYHILITYGKITTSVTAGTINLQWAQGVATLADTILLEGSFLQLTKVQ